MLGLSPIFLGMNSFQNITWFCCFQVLTATAFTVAATHLKVSAFKIKYSSKLPGSVLSAADPSLERADVVSVPV